MKAGQKTTNVRTRKARLKRNAGLIDRLLACPVKDWFVPLASESTRALKPCVARSTTA